MGLIIFIICLVIVFRRQRRNVTLVVPAVIGGIGLLGTILTLVSFVGTLEAVANVAPADKATILANGISEAINEAAFWLIVELPIFVAAYFFDRWLRRRQGAEHALNTPTSTS